MTLLSIKHEEVIYELYTNTGTFSIYTTKKIFLVPEYFQNNNEMLDKIKSSDFQNDEEGIDTESMERLTFDSFQNFINFKELTNNQYSYVVRIYSSGYIYYYVKEPITEKDKLIIELTNRNIKNLLTDFNPNGRLTLLTVEKITEDYYNERKN
jgi:hypothetical protein